MAYGLTKSATLSASSNQYFNVSGGSALVFTNNFTLEGWFYITDATTTGQTDLIAKWADVTLSNCSYYFKYASGSLSLENSNGSNDVSVSVTASLSNSTWYHLAVTFASGSVKFYVNGAQQGTTQSNTNTSINSPSATPTYIGSDRPSQSGKFNGSVSLCRIWTQVQSQATIAANMCTVFGTATTGLVAEWSLDNVLTDASGNGLTLTNHGSATFATNTPATCATVIAPANPAFLLNFI